jgi:type 1 glutamine amidotransferase
MDPCRAALLAFGLAFSPAAGAPPAEPVKALLITGGCCHDYAFQTRALEEAPAGKGLVAWKVVNEGGTGTRAKIGLYEDPRWADGFDVVVHNECFADTDDPDYIRRIVAAHREGVPAVVIHCAMHTYRAAKIDDWRELLGVTSRRHEHQSRYPVTAVAREHPILALFPDAWTSPGDELYVIEKLWPSATALATARSERTGKEHPVFWVNTFGKARVFGTTFGHSSETFADPVFLETVVRGLLWAAGRLEDGGEPPAHRAAATDWAHSVKLPAGEKAADLFDGKDLGGWEGQVDKYWSVADGAIRGANTGRVPASTYLFTRKSYRDFRLLLEARQTRSPEHSTMHSAVAVLGEKIEDRGEPFGFRGPLLMFANDWGIWDAHRRNRVHPPGHEGTWNPAGVEREGDWNRIEILVRGNRIRFVANGKLVLDFTDRPEMLRASPIGLQLHSNDRPQEYRFRGLVLVEDPRDELATLTP